MVDLGFPYSNDLLVEQSSHKRALQKMPRQLPTRFEVGGTIVNAPFHRDKSSPLISRGGVTI